MLFEYFGCKAEGALIREAVDASRTPMFVLLKSRWKAVRSMALKEVGTWIVDYINN
ncbi:MAG: hypothetical protein ACLRS8_05910 [Parabacteroides merdae]